MRIQETLRCIIIALTVLSFSAFGGEITVYTNLESDEVADYVKVVQKDLPDIKINVPRLSTGDLRRPAMFRSSAAAATRTSS